MWLFSCEASPCLRALLTAYRLHVRLSLCPTSAFEVAVCDLRHYTSVICLCLCSDLRKSDSGIYTCRAVSETGETARGAALVVETPTNPRVIFHRTPEPSTFPGSPSKPTVTDVTESSVLLTWRPSSTHGASPVFAYTVEYFSHDTGEVRVQRYFAVVRYEK